MKKIVKFQAKKYSIQKVSHFLCSNFVQLRDKYILKIYPPPFLGQINYNIFWEKSKHNLNWQILEEKNWRGTETGEEETHYFNKIFTPQ